MALLTREEGLHFVQNLLGIPLSEVPDFFNKSVPASSALSFLETVIVSFLEKEPFQSIYLMSHPISQRRRPSWEEIKRDLMLGRGGLCYWQNAFMYSLLSSLGLEVSLTFSNNNVGTGIPNNHVVVLVHQLTPGSLHVIDVGIGIYFPRAFPLDFVSESPEYTDSFLTYKLKRESDGVIYFMKKIIQETPLPAPAGPMSDKEPYQDSCQHVTWQMSHSFNPSVVFYDLEPLFPSFDAVFSDHTKLVSHSSPRAMCWRNGRFIALVNLKLIEEVEGGKLKKTPVVDTLETKVNLNRIPNNSHQPAGNVTENHVRSIDNVLANGESPGKVKQDQDNVQPTLAALEPLVQAYEKYFPQLPRDMVEAALRNWLATGTLFPLPQLFA